VVCGVLFQPGPHEATESPAKFRHRIQLFEFDSGGGSVVGSVAPAGARDAIDISDEEQPARWRVLGRISLNGVGEAVAVDLFVVERLEQADGVGMVVRSFSTWIGPCAAWSAPTGPDPKPAARTGSGAAGQETSTTGVVVVVVMAAFPALAACGW